MRELNGNTGICVYAHVCMCVKAREEEREVALTKVALYRKTIRTFAPAGQHVRIRQSALRPLRNAHLLQPLSSVLASRCAMARKPNIRGLPG